MQHIVISEVKCFHNASRYNKFIQSRIELNKIRDLSNIRTENHHIIPRSMGGSNDKSNYVRLTLREHFLAHLMLALAYKNSKMTYAFYMMGRTGKSRLYEQYKLMFIESISGENSHLYGIPKTEEHKEKIRLSQLGIPKQKHSEETKQKMRDDRKGHTHNLKGKDSPMYGRQHTDETKRKMGEANGGNKHYNYGGHLSDVHKARISASNIGLRLGIKKTDEHKRKISETLKGTIMQDDIKDRISITSSKYDYHINGQVYLSMRLAIIGTDLTKNEINKYLAQKKNFNFVKIPK